MGPAANKVVRSLISKIFAKAIDSAVLAGSGFVLRSVFDLSRGMSSLKNFFASMVKGLLNSAALCPPPCSSKTTETISSAAPGDALTGRAKRNPYKNPSSPEGMKKGFAEASFFPAESRREAEAERIGRSLVSQQRKGSPGEMSRGAMMVCPATDRRAATTMKKKRISLRTCPFTSPLYTLYCNRL